MSGLLGTYGYMLVFPLLGVFAYLCNQYHVKEKSVIKVMLCVYVVLFAMRGLKVGFDYYNYAVVFQYAKRLDSLTFFASTRYMEIGYLLLNKLVLLFTKDIRIFQALIAAVYSVCVYRFTVRFTDSPLMAFTIFYGLGSMFNLMNLTRSALACAICLEAFIQFERSKWKRGFLFVGLACLIHNSAILGVFGYILFRFQPKLSVKNMCLWMLGTVGVTVGFYQLLHVLLRILPRYQVYFTTEKADKMLQSGTLSYSIVFLVFFAFAYLCRGQVYMRSTQAQIRVYNALLWLCLLGLTISIVSIRLSLVNRFMFIPLYSLGVLVTMALRGILRAKERLGYDLLVLTAVMGYCYIYLYMAENGLGRDGVVPYYFL